MFKTYLFCMNWLLMNARARNAGWRIDYFVVSNALRDHIVSTDIHNEIFGSDHCPVELVLSF